MDEVRRIRKEHGLSQQRLSELAGVDKVTIVHIEGGKVSPKVETLEKLARALDVEMGDFFPKAEPSLFPPEISSPEQGRHDVDVPALNEAWAESVRQQREFQEELLNRKLGRAETEQEREEAYRNFKNWWVLLAQTLMTGFKHIPEMPGPALIREGEITAERVREFARPLYSNEAERDAELRTLEDAFTNEAHAASE